MVIYYCSTPIFLKLDLSSSLYSNVRRWALWGLHNVHCTNLGVYVIEGPEPREIDLIPLWRGPICSGTIQQRTDLRVSMRRGGRTPFTIEGMSQGPQGYILRNSIISLPPHLRLILKSWAILFLILCKVEAGSRAFSLNEDVKSMNTKKRCLNLYKIFMFIYILWTTFG